MSEKSEMIGAKCDKTGWVKKKLGEVCEIKNGFAFKSSLFSDTGNAILRISNIQGGEVVLDNTAYFKDTTYSVDLDKYKVIPNDIVMALSGATTGKIGINNTLVTFYLNQRVALFREKSSLNHRYLLYYLKTITEEVLKYAGGAAQPNISTKKIKTFSINVPTLTEQQHIVSELDCLNGIIEKQKEQLKQLDELAQSIFYDMFGDPVENEKGWNVELLGDVCCLKAGKSIKANEICSELSQSLYPCYGGNGIRGFINRFSHEGPLPIIGRQGALCGNVVLANGSFYATEHAVVVRPKIKDINILWLFKTLLNLNLNRLAQGVAQPGLAVSALNKVDLIFPPLSLQQSFASKIEAIEHQKELIKQSLAETENLFNSRMDYYFG